MLNASNQTEVHSHVFLGEGHDENKRRRWWVIGLCTAMMVAEIGCGLLFGSIALVADGLHMSTHAGALRLAALAYSLPVGMPTIGVLHLERGNLETWRDLVAPLYSQ